MAVGKNLQVVQTAYEAFATGRAGDGRDLVHPDAQWRSVEGEDGSFALCHDRDEMLATFRRNFEQWGEEWVRPTGYVEAGDDKVAVALLPVERNPAESEPRPKSDASAQVVTLTDDKIAFIQDYWTLADAMRAVGLVPGQ
jgi:ketosteroid isomerase-like protein